MYLLQNLNRSQITIFTDAKYAVREGIRYLVTEKNKSIRKKVCDILYNVWGKLLIISKGRVRNEYTL